MIHYVGTMAQLFDVGNEECSVILLWAYSAAAIALTAWSTFLLWLLSYWVAFNFWLFMLCRHRYTDDGRMKKMQSAIYYQKPLFKSLVFVVIICWLLITKISLCFYYRVFY